MRPLTAAGLHLLACPVCRGPLVLAADHILCSACSRRYPIVDGIPVLLPERAS